MSFDVLREFDTFYTQKPTQSPASSSFSYFDSLSSSTGPSSSRKAPSPSPIALNFTPGDGFLPPQRPSSVALPNKGTPAGQMSRSHSNSLLLSNSRTSTFNDLIGLFDGPTQTTPVNIVKQAPGRSASPQGVSRKGGAANGAKDPFATLLSSSNLKSPFTPTSSTPQFGWSTSNGLASPSKSPVLPLEQDDDFGDFTSASTSPVKTPTIPTRSLQDSGRRSLSISTPSIPNYRSYSSQTIAQPKPQLNTLLSPSLNGSGSLINTFPLGTSPADDDFGDFIASPVKTQTTPIPAKQPKSTHQSISVIIKAPPKIPLSIVELPPTPITSTIPKQSTVTPAISTTLALPPLSIPLSILLTAFPTLFQLPTTHLFSKLTKHSYSLRQRILSTPQTRDFLLATCEIARVAGRIIAGRQRIRQRQRKLPGTKQLTSEQTEIQKEDREINELVRIWKEDVYGRVKSAMIRPNTKEEKVTRVPELETDLRAEKMVGGNILDEEQEGCKLCGLMQAEIVRKLHEPEDRSEGEWWVRGWGHKGCRNWWGKWEAELLQKRKRTSKG